MLYLNITALGLIVLVTLAITLAGYRHRDSLFYLRTTLLLIPALAEVRQILVITEGIYYMPYYIFVVYFALRLIGPLINCYAHILAKKKPPFTNFIFIATYILFAYMVFELGRTLLMTEPDRAAYILDSFQKTSWFSITFPVLQLLHIIQAMYVLRKSDKGDYHSKYFISIAVMTSIVMLTVLQLAYFITSREVVEFYIAPSIFITLYSVLLIISIKYSAILDSSLIIPDTSSVTVFEDLSKRENEVLVLIADGKSDKEIADQLNLSVNTIATYCRRIYTKLGVNNRTEATILYLKN